MKTIKNNFDKWQLLLKVLTNEIEENDPLFQEWLKKDKENEKLYHSLINDDQKPLFDKEKMYANISRSLSFPEKDVKPDKKFYHLSWLKYASVIIFLMISSVVFILIYNNNKENIKIADNNTDTIFDNKKVILTLANGKILDLTQNFNLEEGNNFLMSNDTLQGLSYKRTGNANKTEYHTLSIPVGGEYELKLEDGTKVYLNSGTKLTYPSQFNEDKRTVSLTGEAYFDVANNGQPFIVHTNDVDIKVLGTSFNVSAYKEDSFVNTTLINGKVQVKVNSNHSFFDMNPGYNLAFQKETGKVVNAKVDTELYTAWRKGEFFFKGQTLDQIFAKLSRWYDFTVEYQDPDIRYERFTGGCDKHNPIDVFLKQIELVTNIKHTKNGSRITVYR